VNIESETRKELKNVDTWMSQAGNIIHAVAWAIRAWLNLTLLMIGALCTGAILSGEWLPENFTGFRESFVIISQISGLTSAFTVVVFGLPWQIKNRFNETAERRVVHHETVSMKFAQQQEDTDRLLLTYGLISQDQIDERRESGNL
jgi:hypothetical protein